MVGIVCRDASNVRAWLEFVSEFSGESDEKEPAAVRAHSRSSQHERDRAPVPDASPHRSAPSRAQTRRDQASPSHPGRTHSYKTKHRKSAVHQRC